MDRYRAVLEISVIGPFLMFSMMAYPPICFSAIVAAFSGVFGILMSHLVDTLPPVVWVFLVSFHVAHSNISDLYGGSDPVSVYLVQLLILPFAITFGVWVVRWCGLCSARVAAATKTVEPTGTRTDR